ncbi:MAG: hypothetical protein IJ719_11640 [Clostridia bacterium]|nr:hypothetical protein [Clostridia bacterium]
MVHYSVVEHMGHIVSAGCIIFCSIEYNPGIPEGSLHASWFHRYHMNHVKVFAKTDE